MTERDGRFSSSEDDDAGPKARSETYIEEQEQLRDSFKHALKDEDDDEGNSDFLKIKQKTKEEKHKVYF